jgi:hypothetical protein
VLQQTQPFYQAPRKGQKTRALYALLWHDTLTLSARKIGAWLVHHANSKTGRCDPGQDRLRRESGLCLRSVKNAVQELEREGLVSRIVGIGDTATEYRIEWARLDAIMGELEARATAGGASECTTVVQPSAPVVVHSSAPKPIEGNAMEGNPFKGPSLRTARQPKNPAVERPNGGLSKERLYDINPCGWMSGVFDHIDSYDDATLKELLERAEPIEDSYDDNESGMAKRLVGEIKYRLEVLSEELPF